MKMLKVCEVTSKDDEVAEFAVGRLEIPDRLAIVIQDSERPRVLDAWLKTCFSGNEPHSVGNYRKATWSGMFAVNVVSLCFFVVGMVSHDSYKVGYRFAAFPFRVQEELLLNLQIQEELTHHSIELYNITFLCDTSPELATAIGLNEDAVSTNTTDQSILETAFI